jgi:hypothetical protein
MAKMTFPEKCPAENDIFAIFSKKIRTWATMHLKVGFISGFKGLVTDWSDVPSGGYPGAGCYRTSSKK